MSESRPWDGVEAADLQRLVDLLHPDPHAVLGVHPSGEGVVVRSWRPDAITASLVFDDGRAPIAMEPYGTRGLFACVVTDAPRTFHPRIASQYAHNAAWAATDPWSFLPTVGELDLHLFAEGRHLRLQDAFGANVRVVDGVRGVAFVVWAPTAQRVSVVGVFNDWDGRLHPMRALGASGVWELFIPDLDAGTAYQFEIITRDGDWLRKSDPLAKQTELRPSTRSVVAPRSTFVWTDADWLAARALRDPLRSPMSVYELHAGSWMRHPDGAWLSWRELAPRLADHLTTLGFTHVELLPVSEHPFDGSWGYQVTGYFAPTARFGSPDDFRFFVDHLHARGIGVLVDWVPAHFPKDAQGLARFDGSALYEHLDPRQGEHPDWGTLVFNFGRKEVAGFLLASALHWIADFHIDGLRVDAVASMLYLDYSRPEGQWVPNVHGGRENLDAIALLQSVNTTLHGAYPGVMVIAEESTAWPGVSRPVYAGGLGFTLKWNMGWMHDTLGYFARDPVHRRWHHHELTFGLVYQWSEHYVLALSHDEVVHLKRSLVEKMPGDAWQRRANLRALYAWMWCHPGKKLLFMGQEFAQEREWSHDRALDWGLRDDSAHRGVERLVGDLNALYRATPALYARDEEPAHFRWIEAHDADAAVYAFAREDANGNVAVCILHGAPRVREGYVLGLPRAGVWREALNSDGAAYGGSNVGNHGRLVTEPIGSHGLGQRVSMTLPPLGAIVLLWRATEQ